MLLITVVAIRLIGLWMLATHLSGTVAIVVAALNLSQDVIVDQLEAAPFIAMALACILPLATGLVLILMSGPLARMIVPRLAHDLPAPSAISARTVTQLGVFFIGLWLVGVGLPVVIALWAVSGIMGSLQHLVTLGVGLILMLGSGLFAGFIAKLRSWP